MTTGLNGSSREAAAPRPIREPSSRKRTPKTSERIAHELVNYIIDNELEEGTALPIESELVATMDVGRTTIREALLLLETWGVVTIRPGRNGGPTVRRPRPDDLQQALALQLQFASADLQDVIEARTAVEPMSARLAAVRMTPEEIDELEESVKRMRENPEDHRVFIEENRLFHSLIAESTRSVVLRAFSDSIKSISDGAVAGIEYGQSRRVAVADAHQRIVDAVRAGDADMAEKVMRDHIEEARVYWAKLGGIVDRSLRQGIS